MYNFSKLSPLPLKSYKINKFVLSVVQNDITKEKVDAIVNAANNHLGHWAGVAGAISNAGGKVIDEESEDLIKIHGKIQNGESVTTNAGRLPCTYVIHSVGPVWRGGNNNEREELGSCMKTIVREAEKNQCKTISIPAISSGIFGFPKDECAYIMISQIIKLMSLESTKSISEVRFCNFDSETANIFKNELEVLYNSQKLKSDTSPTIPPLQEEKEDILKPEEQQKQDILKAEEEKKDIQKPLEEKDTLKTQEEVHSKQGEDQKSSKKAEKSVSPLPKDTECENLIKIQKINAIFRKVSETSPSSSWQQKL